MADVAVPLRDRMPGRLPEPTRGAYRPALLEAAAVLALVIVAALIRWPNFMTVPPFTDETEEALRAWAIAQGELRPLTNVDAYIGALWGYLVAGAFNLLGRHPEVPRLASLLAGSLTVGATYLLGRAQFGRAAGAVAAVLMAGNAAHVLVNSHVAWSNCATPLFTTVAFWLLVRAVREPARLRRWALAGLAWGLALQTHPSVAAFLLGALAYALWKDRRLPLRAGLWAFGAMLLVGYGNVLLHNLGAGLETFEQAERRRAGYMAGVELDVQTYVASLAGVVVLLVQALGGIVEPHLTIWSYLANPLFLLFGALTIVALAWSARRGEPLALLVVLATLAILPILNQRWSPILASRYLMPVVPICLVAIGGLLVAVARRLAARRSSLDGRPLDGRQRAGRAAGVVPVALAGFVSLVQLALLWQYYGVEIAAGRSNDGALRMVSLIDEQRQDREPFAVHPDLHRLPMGGGGDWAKTLTFLLEMEGIRKDVSPRDPDARVRACDVRSVELRYARRDEHERRRADEPSSLTYWAARQAAPPNARRDDRGDVVLTTPYSLPWHNRSLFDQRVPTFETGCE